MLHWQLEVIRWLQSGSSPLAQQVWLGLTYLGDETFYLFMFALLYWVWGPTVGFQAGLLLLLSLYLNGIAKLLFHTPRPFQLEGAGIVALPAAQATAPGPAFPSGHAQGTTVLWTYLAIRFRRPWLVAFGGALILLVSLSRLALGVHWPQDILGGWAIGLALVGLAWLGWRRWAGFWDRRPLAQRLLGAILIPGAMSLVGPWWPDVYRISAMFMGLGLGHVCGPRPRSRKPVRTGLQVLAVGAAFLLLEGLRAGLKHLLPPHVLSHSLRYIVLGLGVTWGIPWLGQAWLPGLASPTPEKAPSHPVPTAP
jgi:membrane-associated phospholipid phosphatase